MTTTPDHPTTEPCRDRGFTLVEILIAIVLVGILSAVVVVGVGSLTDKGESSACQASADAAKAASVVYFTNSSPAAYPTTFTQMLGTNPPTLVVPNGATSADLTLTGQGWTLTMTPGQNGAAPTFTCS